MIGTLKATLQTDKLTFAHQGEGNVEEASATGMRRIALASALALPPRAVADAAAAAGAAGARAAQRRRCSPPTPYMGWDTYFALPGGVRRDDDPAGGRPAQDERSRGQAATG